MNRRRSDYDVIRVLSMLGVVYLHTASGALQQLDNWGLWNFSNLCTVIATPAVPLFFMLSGALLLSSPGTEDLGYLFRHRLPRVVLPLLFWSLLILGYYALSGQSEQALSGLQTLLNTPVVVPYWFLYALIPLYLLSPLLKRMCDHLTGEQWNYMMALWALGTITLRTIRRFVPGSWEVALTVHYTLNIDLLEGYLGYFLLGAYLERLEKLPSTSKLAGFTLVCFAVNTLGTRWDAVKYGVYAQRFTNYITLFTLCSATALFLLSRSLFRSRPARRWVTALAGLSFPVYLAHPLVLGVGHLLLEQSVGYEDPVTILGQAGFYLLVCLACLLLALGLSSVPGLCTLATGQSFSEACRSGNLWSLFSARSMPSAKKSPPET